MSKDDFLLVEGFKEKMANKVYNSIHSKLNDANLIDIMIASNLFGRGMGKSRLRAILAAYPNILMKKRTSAKKRELVKSLSGFASKTASKFVKNITKCTNVCKWSIYL